MPGVDPAWSIFGFVDRDFEVRCIWQYLLQQRRMGYHTALFLAGRRLGLKHAEESYCRDTDRIEQRHLGHSISPKLSKGKQGPNRLQGDHDAFISSSHLRRPRRDSKRVSDSSKRRRSGERRVGISPGFGPVIRRGLRTTAEQALR